MSLYKGFIFLILVSGVSFGMTGQILNNQFKRYSLDEGLTNPIVHSISQDHDGFIWVCNKSSIDRFNGYTFQTLQIPGNDTLNIERFACIHIDQQGFKYIGTEESGLIVINPSNDEIELYQHDPSNSRSVAHNYVDPIFEDSKGRIWMGTYGGGVQLFDKSTKTFTTFIYPVEDQFSSFGKMIYKIKEGPDGHIWIGTDGGGLYDLDPESGQMIRYINDPNNEYSIASNYVFDLDFDNQGRLWLATYQEGLTYLELSTQKFYNYQNVLQKDDIQKSLFITSVNATDDRGIWIGYEDQGLQFINFESGSESHFPHDPKNDKSLSNNTVDAIFIDNERNIWAKSRGAGISLLPLNSTPFQQLSENLNVKEKININDIQKILIDKNSNTWIAHKNNGIDKIEYGTGKIYKFNTTSSGPLHIDDNSIIDIELDESGNLWVGTQYSGLIKIDIRTNRTTVFSKDKYPERGPESNWIFDVMVDSKNNIWVGYANGFSVWNSSNNTFQHYPSREGEARWYEAKFVYKLIEDSNENIWLSVDNGLAYQFDVDSNVFSSEPLSFHIHHYKDDVYWYYNNGAIWSVNLVSKNSNKYPFSDNLFINGIYQENEETLWLASNEGLWKYNLITHEYINFTKSDGLLNNRVGEYIFHDKNSDQLYFITDQGVNFINPKSFIKNNFIPPVHITSLQYFDKRDEDSKPMEYLNISNTDRVQFPHHVNFLKFDFAALSFSKTEKNEYKYRIKGLDDNWFDLGTENSLTLTNLAPGEYELQIQGSNGDGVWNEVGTSLEVIISPPWWKSIWAYIAYAILFVFSVWTFIKWRTKSHKQKLEEERKVVERLKEVDKLKDQFLANTSHELRTPLNGIIGLSESLKDGVAGHLSQKAKDNLEMIISSGKRLSNLVNDILDFSKLKNHELSLSIGPVDLKAAVDIVMEMSRPLLINKKLAISNNLSSNLPLVHADEDRLQQILYNLIGNAIKFTHEGSITVSGLVEDDFVRTIISDTGIGIAKENFEKIFQSFDQIDGNISREYGGSGLGLAVTKQLVEQHGGKVALSSEVGKGTDISFFIPVSSVNRENYNQTKVSDSTLSSIQTFTQESIPHMSPDVIDGQFNILIVDDEPVNRQVLNNQLQIAGYNVFEAINGKAALDLVESTREFNLILLDIMMPGMSGYQVAEKLREKYSPSQLPIILLTAKNRLNDLVAGFNVGANDYLTKPFLKDELLSRVRTHLNLQQMHSATRKFVPEAFINAIGRKNIMEVELGDYSEKNVSVLFTDIRGYTGLSENMSPKENFDFVRTYVGHMGPIIQDSHGFVNQYLGDGIMAIFDKSTDDALQAAIKMQLKIHHINQQRNDSAEKPIKVGMGLATGPLIMGIIGDKQRKDPTTIATTVNIASRIEGLTKYYGANIMIDFESKKNLTNSNHYHLRDIGKAQVKGQETPIDIYECIDGDPPEVMKLKIATIEEFREALSCFMSADFERSKKLFFSILKKNPEDSVAEYFYERSLIYFKDGVDKNWIGIEKLHNK